MTIVENHTLITGGVDTHLEFHVAAAVDAKRRCARRRDVLDPGAGYAQLVAWLQRFGPIDRVGVEGTGSYGTGLSRHLRSEGIAVVEVDRPNRQARRRHGKSDTVDAIAAARAALSRTATGQAKHRDGNVEAIRVLMVARRSAVDERIKVLNDLVTWFCALPSQSGPGSDRSHPDVAVEPDLDSAATRSRRRRRLHHLDHVA